MNKKNKNKGFSLIELIIAIAILVILTGLLAPQFMKYIEKSREAKDVQALDTVYSSIQAALANENSYDEIVKKTEEESDKVYKDTLEQIIKDKDKTAFGVEVNSLLGGKDTALKSKKATANGKICVAIKYVEGDQVEIDVPGKDGKTEKKKIDTFGGFEVMVYCGADDATRIEGLQSIGATIDVGTYTPGGK